MARAQHVTSDRCEICETLEVWPVLMRVDGLQGWSLWSSGDTDLLLARDRRVQLFPTSEALVTAITSDPDAYTPPAVRLEAATLQQITEGNPERYDLDAAVDWLARPDRELTIEACQDTLSAINLATDIGATAGDNRPTEIAVSDALEGVLDALTFGLTLLGDGSPYRNNPAAMAGTITPAAVDAARRLVAIAALHIESRDA